MKKITELIVSFIIGVGIGNLLEMFLTINYGRLIIAVPQFLEANGEVFSIVIQTVLYGGFGIIGKLGSYFFDKEKFSLLFSTIFQLGILLIYFLIVGIYLRWFNINNIILPLLVFVFIYIIIWTTIYLKEKSNIEAINKKLNNNEK